MLITIAQYQASYFIQMHGYDMSSFLRQWIYGIGIMPAKYYARYLRLGKRYEAGICTIVISINGAF